MKECKIGQEIQVGFTTLKCIENNSNSHDCGGCWLYDAVDGTYCRNVVGECVNIRRTDKKNVIYKKVWKQKES